jgi:hypothetical protein
LTVQGIERNLPGSGDVVALITGARVRSIQVELTAFAEFNVVNTELVFIPLFLTTKVAFVVLVLTVVANGILQPLQHTAACASFWSHADHDL